MIMLHDCSLLNEGLDEFVPLINSWVARLL
jgi:hypothetical protein